MMTQHTRADLGFTLMAAGVTVAVGLSAFVEVLAAMPLPRWLYGVAGTAILAAALLATAPGLSRARLVCTWVGGLSALAVLLALHLIPWTSRKPFLQDLDRIHVGMTRLDVDRLMAAYIRGTGWRAGPFGGRSPGSLTEVSTGVSHEAEVSPTGELALKDSVVIRHSNDGRFNSDWGVVTFRDGRVVSVQFMPD